MRPRNLVRLNWVICLIAAVVSEAKADTIARLDINRIVPPGADRIVRGYVSFTDAAGRAVQPPEMSELVVFDSSLGADIQSVRTVADAGEGFALLLMIDVSGSLASPRVVTAAVEALIDGLDSNDRVGIIHFGDGISVADMGGGACFTAEREALRRAAVAPGVGVKRTHLHAALIKALEIFESTHDLPPSRAIALYTDGQDDSPSGITVDDVIGKIRQVNADRQLQIPVFAFAFPPNLGHRKGAQAAKVLLERLAHETDGMVAHISGSNTAGGISLSDALVQLRERLKRQLIVEWPTNAAEAREVIVRIGHHRVPTLTDEGRYFAHIVKAAPPVLPPPEPGAPRPWWMLAAVSVLLFVALALIVALRKQSVASSNEWPSTDGMPPAFPPRDSNDDLMESPVNPMAPEGQIWAEHQPVPGTVRGSRPVDSGLYETSDRGMIESDVISSGQSLIAEGPPIQPVRLGSLRFVGGPRAGEVIGITTRRFRIGRTGEAGANHLVLDEPSVSTHHAEIAFEGGQFILEDRRSSNGTRVDGSLQTRVVLQPGAVIEIGSSRLRFEPT